MSHITGQVALDGYLPSYSNGQPALLTLDAAGRLRVNAGAGSPAALSDASSNPTTEDVGAKVSAFNGSTWDRIRSGVTAPSATVTGYVNTIGEAVFNASPTARTEGQFGPLQADGYGSVRITQVDSSGANTYPASAAPSDAASNSENTPSIRARLATFNGSTWDRVRSGQTGAQTSATGVINTLPDVEYLTTRPTLTNAQFVNLQANSRGDLATADQFAPQAEDNTNGVIWCAERPLAVSTNALSNSDSINAASAVVKASTGKLYRVDGYNANASLRFIQFYNLTAVPADTAVPVITFPVAAGATFSLNLAPFGRYFSTGICWANSTTYATKTIGSADTVINVYYL